VNMTMMPKLTAMPMSPCAAMSTAMTVATTV
jgi:hypothetical protein